MQANIKAKFDNEYTLQLRDKITGQIKQEVKTHNVVLNNIWEIYILKQYVQNGINTKYIEVGSGTGTPAATDKALFNTLWVQEGTTSSTYSDDYKQIETTIVTTFPATTSYVADITEVGINVNKNIVNTLITHALLQDAEGNPITIHKGDLDELIVTAVFRFTMEGEGFTPFPLWLSGLGGYFRDGGNGQELCRTSLSVQRCNRGHAHIYGGSTTATDGYSLQFIPLPDYNLETHKFSFTNSRITADKGNTHYYNSLVLTKFGYWELPNPNIFPYYFIEDIPIGTGDGVTTDFNNPLNYFVKDSEQITKNGVLLTRDVDYTIDYHNNKDMLVELSEGMYANMHSDLSENATNYYPFFLPCDLVSLGTQNNMAGFGMANKLGKDNPIFIEFKEATTINTLRIAGLYVDYRQNDWNQHTRSKAENASFRLSSSVDGVDYTEILVTGTFNPYDGQTFTFTDVTAKYFKLEIIAEHYFNLSNWYYMDYKRITYPKCNECFIGRVGDPYIKFTTPPEDGAELKMTVQMDRPFKNDRFVIDVTGEIQLS